MIEWLRRLDKTIFSPPHTFPTVFSLVAGRLSLFDEFQSGDTESEEGKTQSEVREQSSQDRPT